VTQLTKQPFFSSGYLYSLHTLASSMLGMIYFFKSPLLVGFRNVLSHFWMLVGKGKKVKQQKF